MFKYPIFYHECSTLQKEDRWNKTPKKELLLWWDLLSHYNWGRIREKTEVFLIVQISVIWVFPYLGASTWKWGLAPFDTIMFTNSLYKNISNSSHKYFTRAFSLFDLYFFLINFILFLPINGHSALCLWSKVQTLPVQISQKSSVWCAA